VTALRGTRRRFAIGLVAACAALATASCAAGRDAQTARESPTIDGVNTSVGTIDLRGVAVAPPSGATYPQGGSAELMLVIVNNGQQADQLTNITTSAAGSVTVFDSASAAASALGSNAPSTESPSASDSSSAGSSSSSSSTTSTSASSSSSSSASSSASPSATGSSSAGGFTAVALPAGLPTSFGINSSDKVLVLTGLTKSLSGGMTVPITFTFANAGSVTAPVPVQLTNATNAPTVTAPASSSESVAG
jgi:copper(I)-binding protein